MVAEVRPEYDTEWSAMKAVALKLGIGTTEMLRKWVRQDQIDAGARPGTTTDELAELLHGVEHRGCFGVAVAVEGRASLHRVSQLAPCSRWSRSHSWIKRRAVGSE